MFTSNLYIVAQTCKIYPHLTETQKEWALTNGGSKRINLYIIAQTCKLYTYLTENGHSPTAKTAAGASAAGAAPVPEEERRLLRSVGAGAAASREERCRKEKTLCKSRI